VCVRDVSGEPGKIVYSANGYHLLWWFDSGHDVDGDTEWECALLL